jgi:hypothetical protein
MLRSPLWSKIQATRGACAAVVRPDGNGALSTCSMVNASAKQKTGKRTETIATQLRVFTEARLYPPSGALSKINESGSQELRKKSETASELLTSSFLPRTSLRVRRKGRFSSKQVFNKFVARCPSLRTS